MCQQQICHSNAICPHYLISEQSMAIYLSYMKSLTSTTWPGVLYADNNDANNHVDADTKTIMIMEPDYISWVVYWQNLPKQTQQIYLTYNIQFANYRNLVKKGGKLFWRQSIIWKGNFKNRQSIYIFLAIVFNFDQYRIQWWVICC